MRATAGAIALGALLATATTTAAGWNLAPIEVRGSNFYDSVTGKQFHARGIGMPNAGEDVDDWIKVLQRIHQLSPEINLVRIYVPPTCALDGDCFLPFMQEADKLGIYVLVPGTGTSWGWLPGKPDACGDSQTAQKCYEAGGVLGFGEKIIQHFNYPNTLAILIGNEFDLEMLEFFSLLKAYARDLKDHMGMCNTNQDSPTKGKLRMIPLMYASSDAEGDVGVRSKADYLFCGDKNASVDIFALNVERWCQDKEGKNQYDAINKWVAERTYPGAFMFSEMGCAKNNLTPIYNKTRTWLQVEGFFTNFPAVGGFAAYVYYGHPDFNMFDGPLANATEFDDGKNFFASLGSLGDLPDNKPAETKMPDCPSQILGKSPGDYGQVKAYDTGATGWAASCPKPWQTDDEAGNANTLEIVL